MFPGGEQALADLRGKGSTIDDLGAALGPETDLVALDRADLDKDRVRRADAGRRQGEARRRCSHKDAKTPPVSEEIAGWQRSRMTARRSIASRRARERRHARAATRATRSRSTACRRTRSRACSSTGPVARRRAIDKRAKTGNGPVPGVGRIELAVGRADRPPRRDSRRPPAEGRRDRGRRPTPPSSRARSRPTSSVVRRLQGPRPVLDELSARPRRRSSWAPRRRPSAGCSTRSSRCSRGEAAFYVAAPGRSRS